MVLGVALAIGLGDSLVVTNLSNFVTPVWLELTAMGIAALLVIAFSVITVTGRLASPSDTNSEDPGPEQPTTAPAVDRGVASGGGSHSAESGTTAENRDAQPAVPGDQPPPPPRETDA